MSPKRFAALILAPFLCGIVTSCKKNTSDAATQPGVENVALFEKGKGVCLPDELKKELGVATFEVVEKALPRRLTKTARIYRAESEGKPAGASILATIEEAAPLKPGQNVRLQRPHPNELTLTGTLVRIDESARPALDQVEVLVEFSDEGQGCAVGSFLSATFEVGNATAGFVVPETAVLKTAEGCFVYAVNGTVLTRTPVRIGATSDALVEVLDGLYAGDTVVGKGIENLWLVELSALKGGTPCCPVPKNKAEK